VIGAKSTQEEALASLKVLVSEYARSRTCDWDEDIKFYIPLGVAMEGLHRTRVIQDKGRQKTTIIHPNRPSQRIEIVSQGESKMVESDEIAFDNHKTLLDGFKETQMVEISRVIDLRKALKQSISNCWEVVQRYTAPLTKRRTVAMTYLSKRGKGSVNLNKQAWNDLLDTIRDKGDRKDINLFAPLELERKNQALQLEIGAIAERENALNGRLTLEDLKQTDFADSSAWVSFFTQFGTPAKRYESYYSVIDPNASNDPIFTTQTGGSSG
jgi:hypothetical protein